MQLADLELKKLVAQIGTIKCTKLITSLLCLFVQCISELHVYSFVRMTILVK